MAKIERILHEKGAFFAALLRGCLAFERVLKWIKPELNVA
jgi:hypothetical protein